MTSRQRISRLAWALSGVIVLAVLTFATRGYWL